MRELHLMREKLEYQEKLLEKEMIDSTADLIEHFSDKLREMAFDLGTQLMFRLITSSRKHKAPDEEAED